MDMTVAEVNVKTHAPGLMALVSLCGYLGFEMEWSKNQHQAGYCQGIQNVENQVQLKYGNPDQKQRLGKAISEGSARSVRKQSSVLLSLSTLFATCMLS